MEGDRANTSGLATEHCRCQGPHKGPFSRELETKLPSLTSALAGKRSSLFSNKQNLLAKEMLFNKNGQRELLISR